MSAVTEAPRNATRSRARRAWVIALAAALGLAVWIVADPVLGTDLAVRTSANGAVQHIGAVAVVLTAIVVGLAGWALLALLERLAPRFAAPVWRVIAAVVLLVSFVSPLGGVGGAAKLSLLCLHVAVGLPLLVALPRRR